MDKKAYDCFCKEESGKIEEKEVVMAEKEINERRRGLLKRVLESKTLNRTLKTVVLSACHSGKAMSSKAVEPQVKDAAVDAVAQVFFDLRLHDPHRRDLCADGRQKVLDRVALLEI